jgi:NAD(P)-dependent dehydrogenase (short-subunit alcohol dehydrogenase family)
MATWRWSDVPVQTGKIVLVTGSNQGLGLSLVKSFLDPQKLPADKQPAKVILCSRSLAKADEAIQGSSVLRPHYGDAGSGRLEVLVLDLSDQAKIRAAVVELKTKVNRLDCLVLNAGLLLLGEKQTTKDGLEMMTGVCHFGHFLFTQLVWDLILKADGGHARVLAVSSMGHEHTSLKTGKGQEMVDDIMWESRKFDGLEAYKQAKLANVLFAKELARRCGTFGKTAQELSTTSGKTQVTVMSNSPGFSSTMYRDVGCCAQFCVSLLSTSPDKLVQNSMKAATDLTLPSGSYLSPKYVDFYGPPVVKEAHPLAQDELLAKSLWEATETILGVKFEP